MCFKQDTEEIDLRGTLVDSAQCFHWIEQDGGFYAALRGKPVCLRQENGTILAEGWDKAEAEEYLDLKTDYAAALAPYMQYPRCREAIENFHGIRVLNQDPWETLLSFILSANNNVKRIRGLVQALTKNYGRCTNINGVRVYSFPDADTLANATENDLRGLGTGYRAPYLIETARKIADGFPLYALCDMEYSQAHARLLELPGVGDKVADCVLLFGCRHREAFPVDVWVERLMASWFDMHEKNRRILGDRSRALLGANAGLLQQYLFHAARTGAIEV